MLMNVDFQEDVEVLKIDEDEWDDAFVVGDVHGCLDELETLLEYAPVTDDDLVLFVGDLVRKGPKSDEVVQRVSSSNNMFSVMGNNEWKVLNGRTHLDGLSEKSIEWMSDLPHVITFGSNAVVHGGVNYTMDFKDHTPLTFMNTRAPEGGGYDGTLWYEKYEGSTRVFCGHTVHNGVYLDENSACLDTGCVYGGGLSLIRVSDNRVFDISTDEYLERDEDSIVKLENGKFFK